MLQTLTVDRDRFVARVFLITLRTIGVLVVVGLAAAALQTCRGEHRPGDAGTITVIVTKVFEIDNEANEVTLRSDESGRLLRAVSSNFTIDMESRVLIVDGAAVGLADRFKIGIPTELLPAELASALTSDMTETFDRSMRDCSRLSENERVLLHLFVDDPSMVDDTEAQVCGDGISWRGDWPRFRAEASRVAIVPPDLISFMRFVDLAAEEQAVVLASIDEMLDS